MLLSLEMLVHSRLVTPGWARGHPVEQGCALRTGDRHWCLAPGRFPWLLMRQTGGSQDLDLLSEGLWDPQADPLTSLCFSAPICKLGTASLSYLPGGVRCPARLCHSPGVGGAPVPGVTRQRHLRDPGRRLRPPSHPERPPACPWRSPPAAGGQRGEEGSFLKNYF